MRSRSEKNTPEQAGTQGLPLERLRQLLLPMVAGIGATKEHLVEWVYGVGACQAE